MKKNIAMTGEITLRGRVLPVGGLKEKMLAAHRAGLRTILIPKENAKDLKDLPKHIRKELKFEMVEHMDEVLSKALVRFKGKVERNRHHYDVKELIAESKNARDGPLIPGAGTGRAPAGRAAVAPLFRRRRP